MNDYMTRTHVDFIETYRKNEHFKGYWYLTWIIGPERIVIWRKRLNAGWLLEDGKQHLGEPNISKDREVLYDGRVVARGELQKRLDSILEAHMHKTGQIGGPYEYWKKYCDQIAAAKEASLRNPGKYRLAYPSGNE